MIALNSGIIISLLVRQFTVPSSCYTKATAAIHIRLHSEQWNCISTLVNVMTSAAGSSKGTYDFKVVLLGEGCVGKTSLLLRYVENKFNEKHESTLQASFLTKKLTIGNRRINLSIWDTAGQERFHALGPIYYRDSNGAILTYDITDEDSFQKVKSWVKELKKMLGTDIMLTIVGNKTDLEKQRNISLEIAEEYAESVGATHFQTSAKLNRGVEEVFLDLTKEMIEKTDKLDSNKRATSPNNRSAAAGNVVLLEETPATPTKSGCC